ncbi:hypothetical protein CLOM_g15897 [Closterium sp. NIES-68]|nr:hypothetical protein CLOM_g15897 [Closterium sp. NIES-68]
MLMLVWRARRIWSRKMGSKVNEMASKHHPHLVRLLGFCVNIDLSTSCMEQLLVYDSATLSFLPPPPTFNSTQAAPGPPPNAALHHHTQPAKPMPPMIGEATDGGAVVDVDEIIKGESRVDAAPTITTAADAATHLLLLSCTLFSCC